MDGSGTPPQTERGGKAWDDGLAKRGGGGTGALLLPGPAVIQESLLLPGGSGETSNAVAEFGSSAAREREGAVSMEADWRGRAWDNVQGEGRGQGKGRGAGCFLVDNRHFGSKQRGRSRRTDNILFNVLIVRLMPSSVNFGSYFRFSLSLSL